jgi:hypothetical protein
MGLEERLGRPKALATNADHASVGQLVVSRMNNQRTAGKRWHAGGDKDRVLLDEDGGLVGELLLRLDVVRHVAQLLLHQPHRLKVRGRVECVPAQQEQLVA